MARPNQVRPINSEIGLAERIKFEREQRGWTYEGLAKRMADAGCSINGSAIYKIEKGDPPRRITVDELVALSRVFGIEVQDLVLPINDFKRSLAVEIGQEYEEARDALGDALARVSQALFDWFHLAAWAPDVWETVSTDQKRRALAADMAEEVPLMEFTIDGEPRSLSHDGMRTAILGLYEEVVGFAADMAMSVERPEDES